MLQFTGWQYLLIDLANQYGHDKWTFEKRIEWATENLPHLESLVDSCTEKTAPQFIKAAMTIKKAQAGEASGHMVGLDASCSGMQLMACMSGCIDGARATGLVDPDRRADAYGEMTEVMRAILGLGFEISRKSAKDATMTSFYGSKLVPIKIFGEDTPELNAFYEAAQKVAPGPWELLQDFLSAWQSHALAHTWKMPDGFDVRVKVMKKHDARIEVDELGGASFTYEFYINEGTKKGISLPANVTHSVDAYVLREMHRRCNYNRLLIELVNACLYEEMHLRLKGKVRDSLCLDDTVAYYIEQYERSTLASAVILPHLNPENVTSLSDKHLTDLIRISSIMLDHKPFELVTVHDEFKAHPNHCNAVRCHYREILAELADGDLLDDLFTQIMKTSARVSYHKLSQPGELGKLIRQSNYALT